MPNSPDQIRRDFATLKKSDSQNRIAPATEREYLDCVRNLSSEDQSAIESVDGPTSAQLKNPKIVAARRMWDSLPHEVKFRIAFTAPQVPNSKQNAA